MNYSVEKLTTPTDCDTLMAMANKEKSALEFRKLSLERNRESYLGRSTQLATDISLVNSEIAAFTTILAGLPDGETKEDTISRKKKLEYRLFTLQEQNDNYGVVALLEKEMEISLTEKQLAEIALFSQAIATRKAAL